MPEEVEASRELFDTMFSTKKIVLICCLVLSYHLVPSTTASCYRFCLPEKTVWRPKDSLHRHPRFSMATPKGFPSSARMMNKMVAGTKCVSNFFDGVRESGRALRDPKPGHWRRLSQSIDELSSDSTQEIDKFQSMLLKTTAVCCKNNSTPLIKCFDFSSGEILRS